MAFSGVELLEVAPLSGDLTVAEVGSTKMLALTTAYNQDTQFTLNDRSTGVGKLYSDSVRMANGSVHGIAAVWDGHEFLVAASTGYSPSTRRFRIDETGSVNFTTASSASGHTVAAIVENGSYAVVIAGRNMDSYGVSGGLLWIWDLGSNSYTKSASVGVDGIASHNSTIYIAKTVSTTLTVSTYDPSTDTATPIATHGTAVGARVRGTYSDGWIWWQTNSAASPYFGFNISTGATKLRSLTPATGAPSIPIWMHPPAIINNVAYRMNNDATTMFAVDLNSGAWLSDDLATVRSGRRFGVLANGGNLWIPTSVTPP